MNRIKRISSEVLQKYPDRFGVEFESNKKVVNEVAVVRSKVLRNEIAGYITSHIRKQQAAENKASAMSSEDSGESADGKSEE